MRTGNLLSMLMRDELCQACQAGFHGMTRRSDEVLLAHLEDMRSRKLIP